MPRFGPEDPLGHAVAIGLIVQILRSVVFASRGIGWAELVVVLSAHERAGPVEDVLKVVEVLSTVTVDRRPQHQGVVKSLPEGESQ